MAKLPSPAELDEKAVTLSRPGQLGGSGICYIHQYNKISCHICRYNKAGVRSSFNTAIAWEQHPKSHWHKGAPDANATSERKGLKLATDGIHWQFYVLANYDKTSLLYSLDFDNVINHNVISSSRDIPTLKFRVQLHSSSSNGFGIPVIHLA